MQRIYTRAVTGKEFYDLMKQAGLSRNELIRLTGITGIDLDKIIQGSGDKRPRMADLIVIRTVAAYPGMKAELLGISDEYHDGEVIISSARAERRAKQFGHNHD